MVPDGFPGDLIVIALIAGAILLSVGWSFLPVLIARQRGHPELKRITKINLWLGWTGIGWLYALRLAKSEPRRPSDEA